MKNTIYNSLIFTIVVSVSLNSSANPSIIEQSSYHSGIQNFKHDNISEFERMNYWYENKKNQRKLIQDGVLKLNKGSHPLYEFPLKSLLTDPGFFGISNYVDLNSSYPNLLEDYNCGARTYDTDSGYNHKGIDYFTWPFSWHKMDNSLVTINAAADGIITYKSDGNQDRSCTFNSSQWNSVFVTHADGSEVWYGHMKNGSLTTKTIGQAVVAGEYLGVVGSSGNSTGPHLHLETYDSGANLIEPYSGSCNHLNPDSWWNSQEPYYQSMIVKLATHSSAPSFPSCPDTVDTPNYSDNFIGNQTVYFARYYRDQREGHSSTMKVYRPDNSIFNQWNDTLNGVSHYSASYWWNSFTLPSNPQSGQWRFEVLYQGVTTTHYFYVNDILFEDGFE